MHGSLIAPTPSPVEIRHLSTSNAHFEDFRGRFQRNGVNSTKLLIFGGTNSVIMITSCINARGMKRIDSVEREIHDSENGGWRRHIRDSLPSA